MPKPTSDRTLIAQRSAWKHTLDSCCDHPVNKATAGRWITLQKGLVSKCSNKCIPHHTLINNGALATYDATYVGNSLHYPRKWWYDAFILEMEKEDVVEK